MREVRPIQNHLYIRWPHRKYEQFFQIFLNSRLNTNHRDPMKYINRSHYKESCLQQCVEQQSNLLFENHSTSFLRFLVLYCRILEGIHLVLRLKEKFLFLTFFGADSIRVTPNNRPNLMFAALLCYKNLLVDFQDGRPNLILQIFHLFLDSRLFPIQNQLLTLRLMSIDLQANQQAIKDTYFFHFQQRLQQQQDHPCYHQRQQSSKSQENFFYLLIMLQLLKK